MIVDRSTLIRAYREIGTTVDRLPHSEELVQLCEFYLVLTGSPIGKREAYRTLISIRKAGDLPRLHRI